MVRRKLYETLGLTPSASLADVRKAHREKVKARHPDAGGNRDDFEATQHAYMVLRDPVKRAEYDRTGIDPGDSAPINQRQAQVYDVIASHLAQLIAQPLEAVLVSDAIEVMSKVLSDEIVQGLKADEAVKAQIGKIERLRKRFRRRDGDEHENLLGKLLDGQKTFLELSLGRNAEQRELREEAIEVLKSYQFDKEMPIWVGSGPNVTVNQYQQGGLGLGNIFGGSWNNG